MGDNAQIDARKVKQAQLNQDCVIASHVSLLKSAIDKVPEKNREEVLINISLVI